MHKTVKEIRDHFKGLYKNEMFLENPDGSKMLEIIGASFIADEESIFGTPNYGYIARELEWYDSKSLNVYDIPGKIPIIWKMVADKDGNINSNYGWAIYSEENGLQYKNSVRKLKMDKNSRQAIMIFNRPSMHKEWNDLGKKDFMCCQNVQCFIRDDKLEFVVNFRSNDARFGYINDLAFMRKVQSDMFLDLTEMYENLKIGKIYWNAGSLHVYERDFKLVEEYIKESNE